MSQIDVELAAHIDAIQGTVARSSGVISEIAQRLSSCFEAGGKLLICGNGGSAADSQHLSAEFINRMRLDRRALPAIALTTDTSVLTCIGNDITYDAVFSRQIEALGQPGDMLFALSTSGGSANVLAALNTARQRGMVTVGFTGAGGAARMDAHCDLLVAVPSHDTARIQECHEFLYHFIAGTVEAQLVQSAPVSELAASESSGGQR